MKNCVRLSKIKMHSMCHQPEPKLRAVIFALSSLLLLGGCSELPIQVAKGEPQVKIIENAEPSDLPSAECRKTSWKFKCSPDIRFKTVRRERTSAGESVVIRIHNIRVVLGLNVESQIPKDSPAEIIDHEKGHVELCLDNYKKAQEVADRAAQPWVGKTLQGEGSSFRDAVKKILSDVRADIEKQYLVGTADAVTETASIYDRLTKENPKSDNVMRAVSDAQIEYKRMKPGFRANGSNSH